MTAQEKSGHDPVAVGLVGCGRWGRNILRDLLSLRCRVVVVEPNPENRQLAATLGPAEIVNDISRLPPVEGIIAATPATTHAAVVEALLDRGVPIFCEKPLTTDPASAARLVNRASDRLFVMHIWRYHCGIQELAEIARSQQLGPVLALRTERTNWTSPRQDTDSIWTLVPHDLTIALAILGKIPAPRSAAVEIIADKPVSITAMLGDTPWFSLNSSTRYREKHREVRLHCEDGVAVLPSAESRYIEILRSTATPDRTPLIERRPISGESALIRELTVFVQYLRGGPPPPTDAHEGLAVVNAVAALRRLAEI
ncbi:MAG: Gfo/Idh/MocA family oxidoreductase [Xanthobacteraceae bacterium]